MKKQPDATEPQFISLAVVEDDPRVRASLVEILNAAEGCRCVADFATGEEAVVGLGSLNPQVVVMDIHLPGMTGVECVRELAVELADTQFIMLTVAKDTENLFNALAAGAAGYLLKPVRAAELLSAVRDVVQGGAPMTSSIARQVVAAFHRKPVLQDHESLSERECQVLKLLSEGLLYKQAAGEMGVSINTFCEYIRRIYRKLQVHSRQEAIDKYRAGR